MPLRVLGGLDVGAVEVLLLFEGLELVAADSEYGGGASMLAMILL